MFMPALSIDSSLRLFYDRVSRSGPAGGDEWRTAPALARTQPKTERSNHSLCAHWGATPPTRHISCSLSWRKRTAACRRLAAAHIEATGKRQKGRSMRPSRVPAIFRLGRRRPMVAAAAALLAAAWAAGAAAHRAGVPREVLAFYYGWYGNPAV